MIFVCSSAALRKEMSGYGSPIQILALLLLFLLFANPLFAQYTGGKGSGYAMAELSMITHIPEQDHFRLVTPQPNPARQGEEVSFNLNSSNSDKLMQISLTDIRGKELLKTEGAFIHIPDHFKSGTYIVTVRHSGIITRQKLIIQ
jgi:hypothetical protein